MKIRALALLPLLLWSTAAVADDPGPKEAVLRELRRYAHDAKDLTLTPLRWDQRQWIRFAEGTAAVAAVYAADRYLFDEVQRHRSSFSDQFSKTITPFGGRRALYVSALLVVGGVWSHDDRMRDAGRDSLEAELWAAGLVTPLLKRAFGRARPIQEEGADSFHPFSSGHQSFPSGHATNAFALATGIAAHYEGWVVPTIVYTLASGVAFSRVNDRAHFPSDVLAGALIGRAVGRGIVARHSRSGTTWNIVPAMIDDRPAVAVRLTWR
jgi:membrane-associated phospholipid phosphatase